MRKTIHATTVAFIAFQAGATLDAKAADMSMPPLYQPEAAPLVELGTGWYLRGDVGYVNINSPAPGIPPTVDGQHTIASNAALYADNNTNQGIMGATLGVGYQFNPMFRMDMTYDWRQQLSYQRKNYHNCMIDNTVNGVVLLQNNGDCYAQDQVTTNTWTGLLNSYVDLGTWYGLTPYLGGGIGLSHIQTLATQNWYWATGQTYGIGYNLYQSYSSNAPGIYHYGYPANVGPQQVRNNLAFALMLGAAYDIAPHVKLDVGYRYMYLGQVSTFDSYGNVVHRTIDTQEVRAGLRITPDL